MDVMTTVVVPPYVQRPGGQTVELAAQTVVELVSVSVVAGIVYIPGVGHVVTAGVGATGVEDDRVGFDVFDGEWDQDGEEDIDRDATAAEADTDGDVEEEGNEGEYIADTDKDDCGVGSR